MATNPHTYRMHRELMSSMLKKQGIRRVARELRISHMAVSRYINRDGCDDAYHHYLFAAYLGLQLLLKRPVRAKAR
jgi:hypothetical protein